MAKFKPARPKTKQQPQVRGGLPCVVLVILAFVFVLILLFLVMKYAA